MANLLNQTAYPVAFYAAGCTPETGEIPSGGTQQVTASGPVIPWVEFGRQAGDGTAPVRTGNVPENATVILSVQVLVAQSAG